ncbi:4-alpha-glucanotransferase [Candidatus Clavichlamydia salmonicola]|uniref:4-alpha-glucanotransferase n=1 Tax=Candidatus Clavichlamydia salmonicola TaxID=469812 RepID=UPI00189155AD|nr:4-alpha-glucanotransferase [Candidatus Clavichlamydia salmonicola]MBF5051204.1 4-alpha-glucanotransferase [Candidatus Clavichlamydia salmonicola]
MKRILDPKVIEQIKKSAAGKHWEKIGIYDHHGFCVPLFSLHSKDSCGIGEFYDLIPLIEWAKQVGFDIIQLLPLNDSGADASPYNGISAHALNPIYISIHKLPNKEKVPFFNDLIKKMQAWNKTVRLNYSKIKTLKIEFLKQYFSLVMHEFATDLHYANFKNKFKTWLKPYALFRYFKELYEWTEWRFWPEKFKNPSNFQKLLTDYEDKYEFYIFLQYLCFQQLSSVKKIAEKNKIFLKGDIPFSISKDSVDAWYFRSLFNSNASLGTPPNKHNTKGQNWGFPLYEWKSMAQDDFLWWRERLYYYESFYHMYRVDHIGGFFRAWSIIKHDNHLTGIFLPEKRVDQLKQGKRLLHMLLDSSTLLPIGEDIGEVVFEEMKIILSSMGICGTKIIRWERNWKTDQSFIDPKSYPLLSMTNISSHDSETLQLWWRHAAAEATSFCKIKNWTYNRFLSYPYHMAILQDSHRSGSILHINLLQDYLALDPSFVSPMSCRERINQPGTVAFTNWSYRVIPSVEEFADATYLNKAVKTALS